MMGAAKFRRLLDRNDGISAVEFGLVITPLMFMVMGGMDLGHQVYIQSVAQGALDDASRRASVQSPEFSAAGSTLEERVENTIKNQLKHVAPGATYKITQKNFFDFDTINNPEDITTDKNNNGQYDKDDGDCFRDLNENGKYDTDSSSSGIGGANDVSFYTVQVTMERLFPTAALLGFNKNIDITVEAAVRNQPYDVQPTPAVLCGV